MLARSVLCGIMALGFIGCGGDDYGDYPPVLVGSGAPAPLPGTVPVAPIALGVGVDTTGLPPGYAITANLGSYRVTWEGGAEYRGSFFTGQGAILRLYPGCTDGSCTLVSQEDVVLIPAGNPGRVDFLSYSGGAFGQRSGFDVEVTGSIVYLDLLIDGVRRQDATYFVSDVTGDVATAPSMPFGLDSGTAPFRRGSSAP